MREMGRELKEDGSGGGAKERILPLFHFSFFSSSDQ